MMDDAALREAAEGLALVLGSGYEPVQALWICRTARHNPFVPVAFHDGGGGIAVVIYEDGDWLLMHATSSQLSPGQR